MKPIVPPPPVPMPLSYNPLPDHTQLPDHEGGKPLRPPPGPPPDHTTLPDKDGKFARNSFEYWQSHLLTDSILPVAERLFPQGNYFIGEDCGIYWLLTEPPDRGVKAPDWFFVPGVPRLLDGQMRRSYVLWREVVAPLLLLEYVSDNGAEERDQTPQQGKFWVYENAIRSPYYGIYEPNTRRLEMYAVREGRFALMEANERGHYPIPALGVELGVWEGNYGGFDAPWLRWWDAQGNLMPSAWERAERARQRAEEAERELERLREKLRAAGVDPNPS
jgi:Uma2 family endonuclease